VADLGLDEPATPEAPSKPRHRPPDMFSPELFEQLDARLAERAEYKQSGEPLPEHLTHNAIGRPLGLDRRRVQRAERVRDIALEARSWTLLMLISHPDFWADNGLRFFPTERMTRRALGLRSGD
jgi:hypothetical protein